MNRGPETLVGTIGKVLSFYWGPKLTDIKFGTSGGHLANAMVDLPKNKVNTEKWRTNKWKEKIPDNELDLYWSYLLFQVCGPRVI